MLSSVIAIFENSPIINGYNTIISFKYGVIDSVVICLSQ